MLILVIGGVGAGKSTVLKRMEQFGYQVYRMDEMAKALYQKGTDVFDSLLSLLGEDVLSEDGERIRVDLLSKRIYSMTSDAAKEAASESGFAGHAPSGLVQVRSLTRRGASKPMADGRGADPGKVPPKQEGGAALLRQVEAIVHPAVRREVYALFEKARREGQDIVMETALPDEGFAAPCDEVWYVYADEESRIRRVMENRGYSRERAEEILRAQMDDAAYRGMADIVIDNSGTEARTAYEVYEHCKRIQRERGLYRNG